MRASIHSILVKFEQQQKIAAQFYGDQVFDALSISDVSEQLTYNHFQLLE